MKTYLWESVKVSQGLRRVGPSAMPEYQRMIAGDWAPIARPDRGMVLVASWGISGAVGEYPWCLNLWEHEGWDGLARILKAQYQSEQQTVDLDKRLEGWFGRANSIRTYVRDRMLTPSSQTPTLEDLLARRVRGRVYLHECVQLKPGTAAEYQKALHAEWQPHAEALGLALVGCYRTEMRNDSEAINIWALRDYQHWASLEQTQRTHPAWRRWLEIARPWLVDWRSWLLNPHPLSPLEMGRLP